MSQELSAVFMHLGSFSPLWLTYIFASIVSQPSYWCSYFFFRYDNTFNQIKGKSMPGSFLSSDSVFAQIHYLFHSITLKGILIFNFSNDICVCNCTCRGGCGYLVVPLSFHPLLKPHFKSVKLYRTLWHVSLLIQLAPNWSIFWTG